MTLRRPKNAPLARNPTLAKTNLLIVRIFHSIPARSRCQPTNRVGCKQAYSEAVKRRPEAWKTALPSLIPFSRRRSQAIYSTPRSRRHPKFCPRYVRDILDIVAVFSERPRASAALRRARAGALPFWFSMPSQKGRPTLNSNFGADFGDAASRTLRPRRRSSTFRTFHSRWTPAPSIFLLVQNNTRSLDAPRTSSHRPTRRPLPPIRDRDSATPGHLLAQTYALIAPRARKASPSAATSKTSSILRGGQPSALS